MKALLFVNGEPPLNLMNLDGYQLKACTDGALPYLQKLGFPLDELDFISGDFDSTSNEFLSLFSDKIVITPNQELTDFEKALEILSQKGIEEVDVYGASGKEMDHFLGNLSAALKFSNLNIAFTDQYATYYFIPNTFHLKGVKGRMISLYPYPSADGIVTQGLKWPLQNESLEITKRIGTRNCALEDEISISYNSGRLLIFIHH